MPQAAPNQPFGLLCRSARPWSVRRPCRVASFLEAPELDASFVGGFWAGSAVALAPVAPGEGGPEHAAETTRARAMAPAAPRRLTSDRDHRDVIARILNPPAPRRCFVPFL